MIVRARSLYAAVFAYHHEQICGHQRHFPKLEHATEIEVEIGGRMLRTTFGAAMDWGNREAARWLRR